MDGIEDVMFGYTAGVEPRSWVHRRETEAATAKGGTSPCRPRSSLND